MLAGVLFCTVWRLAPFRPPNVEPIMASMMPFAKRRGAASAVLFAVLAMVLFDLITTGLTPWTAVTAVSYALVALLSSALLRSGDGLRRYVLAAALGTLLFDALTGVVAGAVLFGMPWRTGLIGQIPFTINHLLGNVLLALALSPLVELALRRSDAWDPAVRRAAERHLS